MELLLLSLTLAGSLGVALAIQRAVLELCLKAIAPDRH
jgi:hypothetical protein